MHCQQYANQYQTKHTRPHASGIWDAVLYCYLHILNSYKENKKAIRKNKFSCPKAKKKAINKQVACVSYRFGMKTRVHFRHLSLPFFDIDPS